MQRWKIAAALRSWQASTSATKQLLASDAESQQQLVVAESRDRLARAQVKLRQMEQRARDAEEAASAAEQHAATQEQQIRKLQRRLKEMTLANSKQAQELKRKHAQQEIGLYR